MLDAEHSAIGEQVGVYRDWRIEGIADIEIARACMEALHKIEAIVKEASELCGVKLEITLDHPNMDDFQVILESDVDPSLPKKWGWDQ